MNAIENLHSALAHAMYEGFPPIEYEDRDWNHFNKTKEHKTLKKTRRHSQHDIVVAGMWDQAWGSTALGFGGIGGQAITVAYTIVLESQYGGGHCVYFGGRFAYHIKRPTDAFREDMACGRLKEVSERSIYEQSNP